MPASLKHSIKTNKPVVNLASCNPKSACCVAEAKLGCCEKGLKCGAENKGCCAAVQKCCTEGLDSCKEAKACYGFTSDKV